MGARVVINRVHRVRLNEGLDRAEERENMEWIKCSEKLPQKETPVLIVYAGTIRVGQLLTEYPTWEETFKAYKYWDDPEKDGQDWEWNDVTHWMPLPEPPAV